jgi:predicted MFS family arabinose efflux permease
MSSEAVPSEARPPLALGAWYAACTGAVALAPWLVVLLTDAGWDEAQASALLAVIPAGRLLGIPLWAALADRSGPERVLRGALSVALVASVVLTCVRDPWLTFLAILVWTLSRAPAFPIVDATTVALVGRRYGQVRAMGSLAFLVVAGLSGVMRGWWTPLPVLVSTALSLVTLLFSFRLPVLVRASSPPRLAEFAGLGRHPVLVPLMLVAVLHGATMSSYDHLFALHVEHLALGPSVTGAALATGVGLEIAVLATGSWWLARVGPRAMLALAVASGIPRFLLTAWVSHPLALVLTQSFHGLHFGAFWLAATTVFAEQAPPTLRHTTQSLLPAALFGGGPLLGLSLGAVVLSRSGTDALYLVMAALSAAATGLLLLSYRGSPARPPG